MRRRNRLLSRICFTWNTPTEGVVRRSRRLLEQRLLGGNSVTAGEAIGTKDRLAQGPEFELLVDHIRGLETQTLQRLNGPSDLLLALGGRTRRGGSETRSQPPTLRRGAAHSATTAGRPKERARTPSKAPRKPSWRPQTSARSWMTVTRPESSRRSTDRCRKAARRRLASRSTMATSCHAAATTSPGSPPPEPRSTTRGVSGPSAASPRAAAANSSACRICGSKAPGPRNPAARASARTASSGVGERSPASARGTEGRVNPQAR